MKKFGNIFLAVIIAAAFLLVTTSISIAGPVEIKVVTYFPKNHPLVNPRPSNGSRCSMKGSREKSISSMWEVPRLCRPESRRRP